MPSQRMIRVNELLKREIAELLERIDFDISGCLVSVREVDVSPDLRHAKVHISVLGGNDELNKKIIFIERSNLVVKIFDLKWKIPRPQNNITLALIIKFPKTKLIGKSAKTLFINK